MLIPYASMACICSFSLSMRIETPQFREKFVNCVVRWNKAIGFGHPYKQVTAPASTIRASADKRSHFRRLGPSIPEASLWHCLLVDRIADGCRGTDAGSFLPGLPITFQSPRDRGGEGLACRHPPPLLCPDVPEGPRSDGNAS